MAKHSDRLRASKNLPFEEEYVLKIIKPKIDALLRTGTNASKQDLLVSFRSAHTIRLSAARLERWLRMCGYRFKRLSVLSSSESTGQATLQAVLPPPVSMPDPVEVVEKDDPDQLPLFRIPEAPAPVIDKDDGYQGPLPGGMAPPRYLNS